MRKNRGFTLVELLATVAIMALLIVIAAPSIISTIEKNKNNIYIDDARKLVALAKYKLQSDTSIKKPTVYKTYGTNTVYNRCVAFHFGTLVKEGEIQKGPEGGTYNLDESTTLKNGSFVLVKYDKDNDKYIYSVQLVEEYMVNGVISYKGVKFVEDSKLLLSSNATKEYISAKKSSFFEINNTEWADEELKKRGCNDTVTWY